MRARPQTDIASLTEAYALLGLNGSGEAAAMAAAFRAAVKSARPDQAGGDEERFRRIIAAWRLIQHEGLTRPALAAPVARPPSPPVVALTPAMALNGGTASLRSGERSLRISVPPGLRSGEHLRLRGGAADGGDLYLPVLIRGADGLAAVGDDLFMNWPVTPRLLADGGRLEIETHAGSRSAWIVAGVAPPRLRLRGLGLPARGRRPQGHLFVTLTPAEDAPSAAEDLLVRFTRVWTPDRLAA
jgi:curved DNA-binding protein